MKWAVRILQGLVGVMFLLTGFMKLSGNPDQIEAFNEIYGYGSGFMYVVGGIEVLLAAGLLLGFWRNKLVSVSSGALIIVMAGAVFTHLKAGQGFGIAVTPLVLLVLSLIVFLGQKKFMKT
ncbi:DoxX family protein [Paenibacillus radicis (ex Xue et al. 2023)]|uniref:DoxX family protein n=1 Tax=Paenibacillus radicis (ex Xue et al. 2023) TaxID=2972489 RepID=A0ABT1YHW7_9BACL|nr:DoxX family protein [Paenibacillus radicis (ex Xue et al. 2023)]MCR8632767.1 DoxX family protein [Paenibacillus radicis (ex Xue et al. 2023)]